MTTHLIKRLSLESESYDDNKQYGGEQEKIITLDGGFPPIYEIIEKLQNDIKKREYMTDNSIMSVHNILTDRKKVPFLPLRPRNGITEVSMDFKEINFKRNTKKTSKKKNSKKKNSKKKTSKKN